MFGVGRRTTACDRQKLDVAVNALRNNDEVPPEVADILAQVEHLQNIDDHEQPEDISALKKTGGGFVESNYTYWLSLWRCY